MTSNMTPLLEQNEQFARTYTPVPLGLPAAQVIVVTCLDHRVDPAITLGLRLGDAAVLRNAGGRVTQAVIDEIAYLAFLGQRMSNGQLTGDARATVCADVERLLASPLLPPRMGVSGHVYDVDTGRVTTVVDTRYPEPA